MLVAVLQGSVRSDRMGDRVARWVMSQLEARGHQATLVDAAELKLPMLDRMWKEVKGDKSSESNELRGKLQGLAELYERVDGFAIVTAEYNHSAPPGLVNLIDYFLEEYFYRPSAIVCYSSTPFGGVRAAVQLRALLAEVGMGSIPTLQPIPSVGDALSAEGVALTQALAEKSGKFSRSLSGIWRLSSWGGRRKIHEKGSTEVTMRGVLVVLCMAIVGSGTTAQINTGRTTMHHAEGTFEVKMKPEPLSETAARTGLQRMSMDKVFHGELEATSQGEFLAAGSPDGSAGYVALERVTGTLDGKAGSFALMHTGTMTEKVPELSVAVVPGSGTEGLTGLKGKMKIIIAGGRHSYNFEYSL